MLYVVMLLGPVNPALGLPVRAFTREPTARQFAADYAAWLAALGTPQLVDVVPVLIEDTYDGWAARMAAGVGAQR